MAKYIMIQGTSSNVGKTTICAALCRVLTRKGYKVAPFKASNMGLNSYIDEDGGEMGYGQALQAWACNLSPKAIMNPLLLKPKGQGMVDIVLNGKYAKTSSNDDSLNNKLEFLPVLKAYLEELGKDKDIIVIEGGGSPAEINLPKPDLANMGIATAVNAPVILVGNIELGGVFASLYGTYALFNEQEQALVKGFIINKLHGNAHSLKKGTDQIETMTNTTYLGYLPYQDIELQDEDIVSDVVEKSDVKLSVSLLQMPYSVNVNAYKIINDYQYIGLNISKTINENHDVLIIPHSNGMEIDYTRIENKKTPKLVITFGNGQEALKYLNLEKTKVINYEQQFLDKALFDQILKDELNFTSTIVVKDDLEFTLKQLDLLADSLEQQIDIAKIEEIIAI